MDRLSSWLTLFVLLLFVAMVAVASGYPPDARLMPMTIGLAGTALCLVQLALDLGKARRKRGRFLSAPKLGRPESHDEAATGLGPQTLAGEIVTWGYFLAFIATVLVFGFYVAVPAVLFFYLWREAGIAPATAVAAGAGAGAATFAIFGKLFGFALFAGFASSAVLRLWTG